MELKEFKIEVLPLRNKILKYALKLTENDDDAEDVVQEVLLKLWDRRHELKQYASIEALSITITRNTCYDILRKRKELEDINSIQITSIKDNPEKLLEIKDDIELVGQIIETLPSLQKRIIKMKDIDGYETEEIAKITGCSNDAIRSNLSRARKKVRDIYLSIIKKRI